MSRVALLFAVAFLATAALPSGAAPVSAPPSFSTSLVTPDQISGEPSLILDTHVSPAIAYYTMPGLGVWKSTNGGVTWSGGNQANIDTFGDASIAVDADGVVYLSGLTDTSQTLSSVPMQVSIDGAATFIRQTSFMPTATIGTCDRQWTVARGHGEALTTVRCGSTDFAWRTTDAGVTWSAPITVSNDAVLVGPLAYAPNGDVYQPMQNGNGNLIVARSTDGGLTWVPHFAVASYQPVGFPVVAVDAANRVYVAYDQGSTLFGTGLVPISSAIFVASSGDGLNWGPSLRVSQPSKTGIFPWIAAGAAGKVDVAWYSMNDPTNTNVNANPGAPDLGTAATTWDVMTAQSLNAGAATPSYQRAVAVAAFHTGSICTSGLACVGPQNLGFGNVATPFDRRLLDFFEMRVDPATGNAIIAYPQDRPITTGNLLSPVFSSLDFRVARQTGGTTVS